MFRDMHSTELLRSRGAEKANQHHPNANPAMTQRCDYKYSRPYDM